MQRVLKDLIRTSSRGVELLFKDLIRTSSRAVELLLKDLIRTSSRGVEILLKDLFSGPQKGPRGVPKEPQKISTRGSKELLEQHLYIWVVYKQCPQKEL